MTVLVNYINNVSKKTILGDLKTDYIPRTGEHVVLEMKEYIVTGILYFSVQKYACVYVRKATSNDVTFM